MNFSRISAIVLTVVVPVMAHAQMNQLFGALHSVQNAASQAKQFLPQQSGQDSMQDDQRLATRAQADQAARQHQAQQEEQDQQNAFHTAQAQREQAGRQQAQQMVADQDAKDIAKYKASQQRGQQQAQQQIDAARKVIDMCPDLKDSRLISGERMIRCRNKGLTEEQQMTVVAAMPVLAQAYAASMVQDIYEDNITDPRKGKAIADYYNGCLQRGTPCARPKW